MRFDRSPILAAALALGVLAGAAPAFAQPASPPAPPPPNGAPPHPPRPHRAFNSHIEGRIAFLKAELKITQAQTAAFDTYAAALRQNATEMSAEMKKMHESRGPHAGQPPKPPSAVEQMERRAEAAKVHAAQSQRTLDAFKPLYAQLSDEQKKAADELMGPRGRGPGGHRRT